MKLLYFEKSDRKCTCYKCKKIIKKGSYRTMKRILQDVYGSTYTNYVYWCRKCFMKDLYKYMSDAGKVCMRIKKEYEVIKNEL